MASLYPVNGVCGVFNNTVLPSSSGEELRAVTIECVVWGNLWGPPILFLVLCPNNCIGHPDTKEIDYLSELQI